MVAVIMGTACSQPAETSGDEKTLEVKSMEEVSNREEAEAFRDAHPELEVEILEAATDGRPPNELLSRILQGEVVQVSDSSGTFDHKLLSLDSTRQYSFLYIFFSGEELSQSQIDARREMVVERYQKGQPFAELANQFTMDGNNSGGALGWINEEQMLPPFAAAVRNHKKGEVFPVDIPEQDFHYLVLKTNEERMILRLEILKVGQKQQ